MAYPLLDRLSDNTSSTNRIKKQDKILFLLQICERYRLGIFLDITNLRLAKNGIY